jgi:hypothetical protein
MSCLRVCIAFVAVTILSPVSGLRRMPVCCSPISVPMSSVSIGMTLALQILATACWGAAAAVSRST